LAHSNSKRRVALTIAGSDPGGGAGLQADLKSFAALGVYGYSVITQVIAQNSRQVDEVEPVSSEMVEAQLETLVLEAAPQAVKTGALASAAIVKAVVRSIDTLKLAAPVVDPVIVSSSGALLIGPKGERAIRKRLIPIARIVTPNIAEAEVLARIRIDSDAAIREAAIKIIKLGARAVVIKGGHRRDNGSATATDLFHDGRRFIELKTARVPGGGAHGTGCAFSAAIAAYLARGSNLEDAVRGAKRYVTAALRHSFKLGKGRALLDHFARG
jgi:hydroxymethylpyrimidine/phosphomethylpyrimidine kinase